MISSTPKKAKRSKQEKSMSRDEEEEQEEQREEEEVESEEDSDDEESLAARLMRVEEQLDDLSLQVQDCLHTVEEKVAKRKQVGIDAMNARLESFFAYQVAANQQLTRNAHIEEPLLIFPLPPPSPYAMSDGIEGTAVSKFGHIWMNAWFGMKLTHFFPFLDSLN